ncbi:MAG TPA: 7-carboxy-7-deazaguanine synthase QueE [Nitrospirota bacterium]|nr:7-carboxy-7-deazaguanine synthase QueE [Nitrospirota bacterium]
MINARVEEIYASIQGEGPWVGQRHIFIRFKGCDIRCRYCDTPEAGHRVDNEGGLGYCRVQRSTVSAEYERVFNPLSALQLTEFCTRLAVRGPSFPTLSLTGGEPLLQCQFLTEWLPHVRTNFRIYLETSGIHYREMEDIRGLVDVVSMDFKLPSATGLGPFWDEHNKFLSLIRGKSVFIKAVITRDTHIDDILTSANIIAEIDVSIPFIIQPASGQLTPEPVKLIEFQNAALQILQDVRVIPQVHKVLHVP